MSTSPATSAGSALRQFAISLGLLGMSLLCLPAQADEGGAQTFVQQGCVNCHHGQARSAPTFKRLAEHLGKHGDQPAALQGMLKEVREHSEVHTHQMVSDQSALTVLKWLAQGAR